MGEAGAGMNGGERKSVTPAADERDARTIERQIETLRDDITGMVSELDRVAMRLWIDDCSFDDPATRSWSRVQLR
jgi:hypothetical protein